MTERLDLSAKAPRSIDYFIARLPRYRDALIRDLGLTNEQVDELIAGAARYAEAYRRGRTATSGCSSRGAHRLAHDYHHERRQ